MLPFANLERGGLKEALTEVARGMGRSQFAANACFSQRPYDLSGYPQALQLLFGGSEARGFGLFFARHDELHGRLGTSEPGRHRNVAIQNRPLAFSKSVTKVLAAQKTDPDNGKAK
jgi:hypothetical protein